MPKGPGFDIENPRGWIIENLTKGAVTQKLKRGADVFEVTVSHYLRDEAKGIVKPFLGFAPPEDFAGHGKELVSELMGNRGEPLQWRGFHEVNNTNLEEAVQAFAASGTI